MSILGFLYFVTLINDYSQCTWLFLMKNWADLFSIFEIFFTEVHSILHFTLIFYTFCVILLSILTWNFFINSLMPTLLNIMEWLNARTIVLIETMFTLLLHHNVPQDFGDAILTVCYLINHISSTVLHDQIPQSSFLLNLFFVFPSCLWLYMFCSYFYTRIRQAPD